MPDYAPKYNAAGAAQEIKNAAGAAHGTKGEA